MGIEEFIVMLFLLTLLFFAIPKGGRLLCGLLDIFFKNKKNNWRNRLKAYGQRK